jgi:hypothetical protein
MAGAYETLAAEYDWMFDDDALANGRALNQLATAHLFRRIGRPGAVLDAAWRHGCRRSGARASGLHGWVQEAADPMAAGTPG